MLNLPPRRVSIGESAVNEVPIAPGNGLAPVHFRLQPWESGYFIEDAASGLDTLVNGRIVKWAALKHGDVIMAGGLKLIYQADAATPLPEFPSEAAVRRGEVPATGPEPALPPSWLPPEALLPPVSPVAQAAMHQNARVSGKGDRRWLAAVILLCTVVAAAWYFFRR